MVLPRSGPVDRSRAWRMPRHRRVAAIHPDHPVHCVGADAQGNRPRLPVTTGHRRAIHLRLIQVCHAKPDRQAGRRPRRGLVHRCQRARVPIAARMLRRDLRRRCECCIRTARAIAPRCKYPSARGCIFALGRRRSPC